jgi:hypothetical protein
MSSASYDGPRARAVAAFLAGLDTTVERELHNVDAAGGRWEFEAEAIAAEIAQLLAQLREDLQRHRTTFGR